MSDYLSFNLADDFIRPYKKRKVDWGFPMGGGNSLGELTYLTKYSRRKDNGTKEKWWETCQRVVEGYYSILKDHCRDNRTPWNELRAQTAAKDAYERLFTFKWTPPGRGLWMMGTRFVNGNRNSAALQNCSFVSTEKLSNHSVEAATLPFVRLMEMSMLGVGVGFDTLGAGKVKLHQPVNGEESWTYEVPDTREGWCESTRLLLESYFFQKRSTVLFDYSLVRPAGEPIRGFGGTAAGPEPLMRLHDHLRDLLSYREGETLGVSDIVDVANMIGVCVVAGNVRRSAELSLGDAEDKEFLDLKNYEVNPERNGADGWGHLSNNSVTAHVGQNLDHITDRIADNGEPGIFYQDLVREYGRMIDPPNNKDHRVMGTNPCSEQSLESFEMCTLVETFPMKHEDLDDYKATLKHAYLYGKAVTLLPTHWAESNEIMQRNRRIGCSMSGIAHFVDHHDWTELRTWMNEGYTAIQERDEQYSEWLGVRESIKTTSVKPSGTVSLLNGSTPGVHFPTHDVYIRRMRFRTGDPLLDILAEAGYHTEPDVMDSKHSVVVELPTRGPDVRTEQQVSIWEKGALAVLAQRYWADNQVSCTLTFTDDEKDQIPSLLRTFEGQLKSVSFLPISEGAYDQMPYEGIDEEVYDKKIADIKPMDWKALYALGQEAEGEKFCNNDTCEI